MADFDLNKDVIAFPNARDTAGGHGLGAQLQPAARNSSLEARPSFAMGKPSVQKAQRHRDVSCIRRRTKEGYSEYPLGVSHKRFRRYGIGIFLYFEDLRMLYRFFFFAGLVSIPSMVFYLGGNAQDEALAIEQTTMGHLGVHVNETSVLGWEKERVGLMVSSVDLCITLAFLLVFGIVVPRRQARAAWKYNLDVLTVAHFTVKVTGLPADTTDRREIKRHFTQFGKVMDVALAFNDGDIVQLYKRRGRLKKQELTAEASQRARKLKAIGRKIEELDQEIRERVASFERRCVAAFVTFEHQESVLECLDAYPDSWWARLVMDDDFRLDGKAIRVTEAPEPSNLLMLNLKYTLPQRMARRCLTFFATLVLLAISFTVVYTAQYYQSQIPLDSECSEEVTREEAVAAAGLDEPDQDVVDCYCTNLDASDALDDSLCDDWVQRAAVARALLLVSAATIVIINVAIKAAAVQLGKYERHFSRTSQQSAVTRKLFVGLFANTALAILLVNWDLGLKISVVASGSFSEMTTDWFSAVGTTVLFTMLLNSVNPHILPILLIPWRACQRRYRASDAVTQVELNELYSPASDVFHLAERYAVVLNVVFVVLFYSSGMPLLLWIGAITFFSAFWFDKISFLRLYRRPPRYNAQLAQEAIALFPWAAMLHFVLAVWFFSSPVLDSFTVENDTVENVPTDSKDTFNLRDRLRLWNVLPHFILLSLMVVYQLVKFFFAKPARKLFAATCGTLAFLFEGHRGVEPEQLSTTFSEAKKRIKLESYHLVRQQGFSDAFILTDSQQQLKPEMELAVSPRDHPPRSKSRSGSRSRSRSRSRSAAKEAGDTKHRRKHSHKRHHNHDRDDEPEGLRHVLRGEEQQPERPPREAHAENLPGLIIEAPPPRLGQDRPSHAELQLDLDLLAQPEAHAEGDGDSGSESPGEPSGSRPSMSFDANGQLIEELAELELSDFGEEEEAGGAWVAGGGSALHAGERWAHPAPHKPPPRSQSPKTMLREAGYQLEQLIPVNCESCCNTMMIVDAGVEAMYTCPWCQAEFCI